MRFRRRRSGSARGGGNRWRIITALALDREHGLRLQAAGVTFVDDVDRGAFRDKTRVVYEQFEEWTPGLYDTVQAAMKP